MQIEQTSFSSEVFEELKNLNREIQEQSPGNDFNVLLRVLPKKISKLLTIIRSFEFNNDEFKNYVEERVIYFLDCSRGDLREFYNDLEQRNEQNANSLFRRVKKDAACAVKNFLLAIECCNANRDRKDNTIIT